MDKEDIRQLAKEMAKIMMPKVEKIITTRLDQIEESQDNLLTQDELAAKLKVHPSTLHGKTDVFPHVMVGKHKRFLERKVMRELLDNNFM